MNELNLKKIVRISLIVLAIGVCTIYAFLKSKDFLEGPSIVISYPENGATLSKALVDVTGKAERIAFITLNDRRIYVDESGNLKEQVLLQYGYNVISIKASDRFNRKIEKRIEVIYQ